MDILNSIYLILGIISSIIIIGQVVVPSKKWLNKVIKQSNVSNLQLPPSYKPPARRKLKILKWRVQLRWAITSVAILILILTLSLFTRSQLNPQILSGSSDTGYNSQVKALSWSPKGNLIAIASSDGVYLWDVAARQGKSIPSSGVDAVAWSPDGNFIAFGGSSTPLQIWNVNNKEVLTYLTSVHSTEVNAITWSPKRNFIAFGGDDAKVEIYNFVTRQIIHEYPNFASITALTWSPNGNYLASGGYDGKIHIWDAITGKDIFRPFSVNNNGGVLSLEWSPTNSLLASVGQLDSRVQIWDTTKSYPENQVRTIYNPSGGWLDGIAWSPDGNEIASVGFDSTLRIWNALDGSDVINYPDHAEHAQTDLVLSNVVWSSNGKSLAFGHDELDNAGGYNYYYSMKVIVLCKSWCFIPSMLQTLFGVEL